MEAIAACSIASEDVVVLATACLATFKPTEALVIASIIEAFVATELLAATFVAATHMVDLVMAMHASATMPSIVVVAPFASAEHCLVLSVLSTVVIKLIEVVEHMDLDHLSILAIIIIASSIVTRAGTAVLEHIIRVAKGPSTGAVTFLFMIKLYTLNIKM